MDACPHRSSADVTNLPQSCSANTTDPGRALAEGVRVEPPTVRTTHQSQRPIGSSRKAGQHPMANHRLGETRPRRESFEMVDNRNIAHTVTFDEGAAGRRAGRYNTECCHEVIVPGPLAWTGRRCPGPGGPALAARRTGWNPLMIPAQRRA
jgi:hypothetical protein